MPVLNLKNKIENMEKLLKLIFIFMSLNINSYATQETSIDSSKIFIRVDELNENIKTKLAKYGELIDFKEEFILPRNENFLKNKSINISWVVLKINNIEAYNSINTLENVSYSSYFIKGKNEKSYGITGLLYAKMINPQEVDIQELEDKFKIKVVDLIGHKGNVLKILMDNNTILSLSKLKAELEESLLFHFVDDALLYNMDINCTNSNPFFSSQWGHNNTGQSGGTAGIDINFCQANNITSGSSDIIVAVVDVGVELTHPDLVNNIISGYDAPSNSSGGAPGASSIYGISPHGTNCAGIIAAEDNNIGVVGVAPDCKILPCRAVFQMTQTSEWLANSIDFATNNNADVISNSWSGGSDNALINDAISNALDNGRGGLGCVVVFSTGNSDGAVAYPTNSNPRILAVGANDRCGVRSGRIDIVPNSCDPWGPNSKPGSQYGKELDVVAPGTNVYTTDISGVSGYTSGNYNPSYGGTSSACPYVAGIAALVLSLNPCLTEAEVRYHIESSATTIRTDLYSYSFVSYPNEPEWDRTLKDWNDEVGYGLVNTHGALISVIYESMLKEMEAEYITGNHSVYQIGTIEAGYSVNPYTTDGNYTVASGSNTEFIATETILLQSGFTASAGSDFLARIEDFNGDCGVWAKNLEWSPKVAINRKKSDDEIILGNTFESSPLFFPNPYTNELYVKFDLEKETDVSVILYSSEGKLIYSNDFVGVRGKNISKIDVNTNASLLIAKICYDNDCKTAKLIKNEK